MAVALEDLRRNGGGDDAESLADERLDERIDVAVVADGAGKLAHAHRLGGRFEALEAALHVRVPEQELHAEGGGLRMDAVRAAHDGRLAVLLGLDRERGDELLDAADDHPAGLVDVDGHGRVHDVGRGQAVVEPLRVLSEALRDAARERDHVVVGGGLDLVDARDGESRVVAHALGGAGGHDAELLPGLRGGELDLQPDLEFVLVRPERRHGGARVAFDHCNVSQEGQARLPRRMTSWRPGPVEKNVMGTPIAFSMYLT